MVGTAVKQGGAFQKVISLVHDRQGNLVEAFGDQSGPYSVSKTATFTGAASHGAIGAVNLFVVTGLVQIVSLVPQCENDLISTSGTVELGISGQTDTLIPTTTASLLTARKIWLTATPATGLKAIPVTVKDIAITSDIILTIATANVTAGAIRFDMIYRPLSADGLVEAA